MWLFHLLLKSWKQTNRWSSFADEVAVRCVSPVRNRLGADVQRMSRNESRGYIRARARSVVKRTVATAATQPEGTAEAVPQLKNRVLEATTRLVHQQVINQPFRKPVRRAA